MARRCHHTHGPHACGHTAVACFGTQESRGRRSRPPSCAILQFVDERHLRAIAPRRAWALPCLTPVLRAHLLAVGSDEALAGFLDSLLPHLRQPLYRWAPGQCLQLPATGVLGTLIIENAGALSPSDQRRLFDWLTVTRGDIRIVSTTAVALLPLVESRSFIASLYYRLNIVCIDVAAPSCALDIACALNITVRSL